MKASEDINTKYDAIRQVMHRRKERRPVIELPKEVEDRVMERISTIGKVSAPRGRVVRMWTLRAMSAAAAIASIFFLVETLIPEEKEGKPNVVAKVEVRKPVEPEKEQPRIAEASTQSAQRKKHAPKTKRTIVTSKAEDISHAKAEGDVCIDCEMDAMASDLAAMIDEFENQ